MTADALRVDAEGARLRVISDGRGNCITVDTTAFRINLDSARALIPPRTRMMQVVKGEGYGLGLQTAVTLGLEAGVEGFCAGTPSEALRIKALAPDTDVLLFTGCDPASLAALAAAGIHLSINSVEAFHALHTAGVPARAVLELECGFGRYGLNRFDLEHVVAAQRAGSPVIIEAAYTHFGQLEPALRDRNLAVYDDAVTFLRRHLGEQLKTMVASSLTMLERPHLPYDDVDPGRLLYGLAGSMPGGDIFRPVLSSITSTVLQVHRYDDGQTVKMGYGSEVQIPPGGATGVFPLGWYDGFPTGGSLGKVLVGGVRAAVLARTLLHSIVDLSGVNCPTVGTEVVLVGRQGSEEMSLKEASDLLGVSELELHFRLGSAITARPHALVQ